MLVSCISCILLFCAGVRRQGEESCTDGLSEYCVGETGFLCSLLFYFVLFDCLLFCFVLLWIISLVLLLFVDFFIIVSAIALRVEAVKMG